MITLKATNKPINIHDFDIIARSRLKKPIYDYINGGAGDEYTLIRNQQAFNSIQLLPRVLRGKHTVQTEIKLFGRVLTQPLFVAPMAFHCLVNPLGEIGTVMAANRHGIGMTLS